MNDRWQAGQDVPRKAGAPSRGARVRGLLHGLAVGEVLGAAPAAASSYALPSGPLRHGVATQLACFTAAAGIRTSLRRAVAAATDPLAADPLAAKPVAAEPNLAEPNGSGARAADARDDLLDAYRRWVRVWTAGSRVSTGAKAWLEDVPLLASSTGEAHDTLRGLATGTGGTRTDPVTTAHGWHALARALPLAAQVDRDAVAAVDAAVDSAALTHGSRAFAPTALGVLLAGAALRTGDATAAVAGAITEAILLGVDFSAVSLVDDAVRAARETPASPVVLRSGAPDDSAGSTLWAATYCLLSHPEESATDAALALARSAAFPVAVTTVAGAFLGAVHSDTALPQQVLTRIDLAYVIDRLARDLAREYRANPDGTWGAGDDPAWRARYGIS